MSWILDLAYRILDIGPRILDLGSGILDLGCNCNIDQLTNTLLPHSDPSRVRRFKTCLCFCDGAKETCMETHDCGERGVGMRAYFIRHIIVEQ